MRDGRTIGVVIPTRNEEHAIAKVIADIPTWVDDIVVADNRSNDNTVNVARTAGARVIHVTEGGYGASCQAGIDAVVSDVIVFVDGDYSDFPDQMGGW